MREKTILALDNLLYERNKGDEQHCYRVCVLCQRMGKVLGLSDRKVMDLKSVGLLHDIGKIGIDEQVLNKQGELSEEEWREIKRHPQIGYRIISKFNNMEGIAVNILAHHERWDGQGYPKGLKGEEIPLYARISAVADTYDAMTHDRSYRKALSKKEAIEELKRNAGTQFDPDLVKLFLEKVAML
ncbi:HD-GYP domain-containing protein [Desulfitobacterium sp.]|uniref:HD-GYP domain-containing protein n=1 Tax=Desulfitobacterium sp. TaxID=49981 RepID=UPI002B219040|nr:HD-GYP domain-containing protein [Desulfitobacterium sp.]MEA4902189.1 HD-GYP domain-containing protein [Desulfitobacterium sp.]